VNLTHIHAWYPWIEPGPLYFALAVKNRTLARHIPAECPHIVRDGRLWVCRGVPGLLWGHGFTPTHALSEFNRINHIEHGKSRPLMAPTGRFPVTENHHVPATTAVRNAG
jgi:hypothetical protein